MYKIILWIEKKNLIILVSCKNKIKKSIFLIKNLIKKQLNPETLRNQKQIFSIKHLSSVWLFSFRVKIFRYKIFSCFLQLIYEILKTVIILKISSSSSTKWFYISGLKNFQFSSVFLYTALTHSKQFTEILFQTSKPLRLEIVFHEIIEEN